MKKVSFPILLSLLISACGGGGGGASDSATGSSPPPVQTPVPVERAASATVSAATGVVVLGANKSDPVAATADVGTVGAFSVQASASAPQFSTGDVVLIPGGTAPSLPLGISGKVAGTSVAADGSTTVNLSPVTLAEVLKSADIGSAPVALDSTNFIGVIAPSAVQPSSAARVVSTTNANASRIALGGGVVFRDAIPRVRALRTPMGTQ